MGGEGVRRGKEERKKEKKSEDVDGILWQKYRTKRRGEGKKMSGVSNRKEGGEGEQLGEGS